jgi:flavin reductase (DIM6/NTAB) family NADH-FMN oxidoreductase RutF
MRRMAGTVCIVATAHAGKRFGLTATSVASFCMEPPALLVCVNRMGSTYPAIAAATRFSVNLLAASQVECARAFSSADVTGESRLEKERWVESPQGIPLLPSANAAVLCEVEEVIAYGSHGAFIGRVLDVHIGTAAVAPLLYFDGGYRTLVSA